MIHREREKEIWRRKREMATEEGEVGRKRKKEDDWQGKNTWGGWRERQSDAEWIRFKHDKVCYCVVTLLLVPPPIHVENLSTKWSHRFPLLIHHHSLRLWEEYVKIAAAGWLALLSGSIRMHGVECVSHRHWHLRPWSHNVTSSGEPALMSFAYSFTYS